jgi:hypothetical protein
MRTTAVILIAVMLAGCATVTHPNSPGVQYASMDQCQNQHITDGPGDCAKMLHGEATKEAVGVGATILVVLGYLALIGFIVAGGR